jgi:hypothetical protein
MIRDLLVANGLKKCVVKAIVFKVVQHEQVTEEMLKRMPKFAPKKSSFGLYPSPPLSDDIIYERPKSRIAYEQKTVPNAQCTGSL